MTRGGSSWGAVLPLIILTCLALGALLGVAFCGALRGLVDY